MARAQAAALRNGVEKFRDNDNAVKVFEMTLRNEVRTHHVLLRGGVFSGQRMDVR